MKISSKNPQLGVLNPLALAAGLALALTPASAQAQSGTISGHVTVGQTGVGARTTWNRTENIVFSRGGTTYASDVTGNGYTANFAVGYTNMSWLVAPGTGPFPAAKGAFQTGSGYLVVPNATNALNPLPMTVMAWVNTTNATGPILGKVVGNPNATGYLLMVYQGNASAVYWGSSGNYVDWSSGTTTISDGAWHQIAYTVDASGGKLYVDGALQATKGWTGTARSCGVTLPLYFGATDAQRTGSAGWSYLPGSLLSEASLWNTALNASQIAGYLKQGPAGTETNLMAYWPLASAVMGASTASDGAGSYTNSGLYSNVGPISLSASYLGAPFVPASQMAAVGATNVNFVELTALVNPLWATNVQATSATLYGTVVPLFPGATNSSATFNYGPTTNYGLSVVATTNLPGANLTLDGVSNFLSLPNGTYFATEFTIEVWVRLRSFQDAPRIVDLGWTPTNEWLAIGFSTNGTPFFKLGENDVAFGGYSNWISSNVSLPTNQWCHLACVYAESSMTGSIYLNGNPIGSDHMNVSSARTTAYNFIGRGLQPTNYAAAALGELRIWQVALPQTTIQEFMNKQVDSTHPQFLNLLHYYPFNETSGATAGDFGSAYYSGFWFQGNATLQGGLAFGTSPGAVSAPVNNLPQATTNHYCLAAATSNGSNPAGPDQTFVTGYPVFNTALAFNGLNAAVNTSAAVIPTTGDFTVECWVNCPASPNSYREFLSQGSPGNAVYLGVSLANNIRAGDGWGGADTGVPFPLGGWHHFALVKSSTDTILYVDGVRRANRGFGIANPAAASGLVFGEQYGGGGEFWPGSLDEARVWNVALSQATIQSNLYRTLTGTEAGLRAYYRFDDACGTTVQDATANHFDGVFVGSPAWVPSTIAFQPTLDPIANLNLTDGQPATVLLTGIGPSTLALNFSVTAVSDTPSAVTNLLFYSAPGSNGTLVIIPQPPAHPSTPSTITVTVTNGPFVTNRTFLVTVSPAAPMLGDAALRFNGTNNAVVIPSFGNIAPTNEITIEFWQKVDRLLGQSTFILSPDDHNNRINAHVPYSIGTFGTVYWDFGDISSNGRVAFQLNNDITSGPGDALGGWHHFALVSSQSANAGFGAMQIYLDGSLVASSQSASSFTRGNYDLVLGGGGTPYPFAGALSEFRVWNMARTGRQILANMRQALAGDEPGLLVYYRVNEGGGYTLFNSGTPLAGSYPGALAGGWPYPTWVPGPTNFNNFTVTSFSTNNLLYLPAFDLETAASSLVWHVTPGTSLHGTLTNVGGGKWLYTPDGSYLGGNASFTYTVNTGAGTLTSTGQVLIAVTSLNPPILGPVPSQLTQEGLPTAPILFTLSDTSTAVQDLNVSVTGDNQDLVDPASGFSLALVSTNGVTNEVLSLVITPKAGAIGSANITVQANDGHNLVTETFVLQVNPQPAYTIIDLGVLSGRYASYGRAINNQGQIVGYCTLNNSNQNASQAFYYTGFGASQQTLAIGSGQGSAAYAISDNGVITGTALAPNGYSQAFLYDSFGSGSVINLGALGTNSSGSASAGFGINSAGRVVGGSTTQTSGQTHAFNSGANLIDLGLPGGSVATGINDAGQVVGYVFSSGITNTFIITPVATNGLPAATNYSAALLPGAVHSLASGINQAGDVVGACVLTNGFPHAWIQTGVGGLVDLGTPPRMFGATAYGVNKFDQVVGTATSGNGLTHAFLYSTGRINDLNDLIPYEETNTWTLIEARGINDAGAIVGTGLIGGTAHAFLALPAWVAGKPIARPLGAVAQAPAWSVISGPTAASGQFFWNASDRQLYAVVPCTAQIQWPTSFLNPANPTNTTPPIIAISKTVWPRSAQTHVVGAPVQVVPRGIPANTPFNYSFQSVLYATSLSAAVDQQNVFNCQTNAYSVLRYISIVPGQPLDPINSPSKFQVIRSIAWNDPNYLSNNLPAVIGAAITNATHFDYAGRNGHILFQKSVYDGAPSDANRAYDLPTRTGPIIPVNTINPNLTVPDQPLVVVWYHTNDLGVAWGDAPCSYSPQWPTTIDATNTIVIASLQGSGGGGLPSYWLNPAPYVQNDPTLPGFNPNEEHALMAGGVLYALRNDLNALYGNLSQPYVLLKYQDANNANQWAMRVFAVVATNQSTAFTYPGTAGTQIQPPLPLSLLPLCAARNTAIAGPFYHAKVDGSLWATAAGPNGGTTNITLHYWYPLQPGFYYGTNNATGTCIPWLDGGTGTPADITYQISWPSNYVMPVGQTLTTSSGGLPDITHLLNASIVFDSLASSGGATTTNLARLYDPYTARSLSVPASATWPAAMKFTTVNGLDQFTDLPYFLRLRLLYDPLNRLLSFQGLMADTTPGADPLLLNNVMSLREREAIKGLSGANPDFRQLIDQLYKLTRNPNRLTLNPAGTSATSFDDALLIGLTARTNLVAATNHGTVTVSSVVTIVPDTFGAQPKALTTGLFGVPPPQPVPLGSTNYPPEYVTVVQDDPTTPGSQVQMYVIQVNGGPALGNLAVLPGDNAFDQRLTLRHSDDFGGDPGPFRFQWYYYRGDNNGVSPPLPTVDSEGNILDAQGWLLYQVPDVSTATNGGGANYATLGEGGESGLLVMSDNWFISRYAGYNIDGATNWSGWIGQPGNGGAQFVEGWVNRVLSGLNPFDARTTDFHTGPINTYQSMLEQAGHRYEGPIALNSDPNYLNSVGLIEAYQTVLQVGRSLSVDGSPPVNYQPANQALLQAASKISDLYVVLGNEAYAEASDPTIGFSTGSAQFGSLASSIFAFQDQVDTLLDQELDLLRGRDDSATTVAAAPVYNRLYWNFTGGKGEVAYVQTFNITDVTGDGFINAADAKLMFPQGHGDAWGHYLTALTTYYDLLRNTNYTWLPRASAVPVAGVPVQVNYEDEQKFAHAAAAKAQTGAEIAKLTYEAAYVDDPSGQYQGYEDTATNRAWGLSEWARRAGQGAYFDWVTVNALLPATDTNPNDVGLAKVDRTTVADINSIPTAYAVLQNQLNQADAGLNPIGLAKQSVPFDIDPTLIDKGETHFEQVYARAVSAMVNAVAVWNQANQFTSALRQQQDTAQQFGQNIQKQDQDYQSRLIEVFGYPYAGDIGQPGSTYPAGYTGPDLYHYMYVDMSSYNSAVTPPTNTISAYYRALAGPDSTLFQGDVPSTYALITNTAQINYPIGNAANLFQPPASWGSRRAPGELQMALSDVLQAQIRMQEALANYNALLTQIQNNLNLLRTHYNLNSSNAQVQNTANGSAADYVTKANGEATIARRLTEVSGGISAFQQALVSGLPTVVGLASDCFFGYRLAIGLVGAAATTALNIAATEESHSSDTDMQAAADAESQAASTIAANTQGYEMQQQVTALQNQIQQEPALRLECLNQRETIIQTLGKYQAALAKGQQILQARCTFAKQAAAQTQTYRYQDMTFRIFQNDAIQKYKAQFDLAKRYVYMAAIAYDFETELLGTATGSGQEFLTDIIQQQSLGEMDGNNPVNGVAGLADPLARLGQDFAVLKGQLGFNNPQTETGKFSLRYGLFRQQTGATSALPINGTFTNDWQTVLKQHIVPDLWQIPEFKRYCRAFAPQSAGAQPGLVIPFSTTITYGLNFFGWPLSGGDSAYDPTLFSTKVRSVGVWFTGYDNAGLSTTPRIYLIPVGNDMMRSPTDGQSLRAWRVQDQSIPVPFPLGVSTAAAANYIPMNDSLDGTLNKTRQFSSFLGYTDQGANIDPAEVTTDSRLIGRSVWNTQWVLIIPGGTLLADPNQGLQNFVNSVSDIKVFFQTYSYSGN